MNDKRTAYRTQDVPDTIDLHVAWEGHDYIAASLIDLSARGAAIIISLSESEIPAFLPGTPVLLKFVIQGIDPLTDVNAVVRNERDQSGSRVFGLEIIDWRRLVKQLPSRYSAAFNRRRHFRVKVPDKPPTNVEVTRIEGGDVLGATLSNISIGGCLLAFSAAEHPNKGERVRMQFKLSDTASDFDLVGQIASEFEDDGTMRCGIEFDGTATIGFNAQQQVISQYVMDRQCEMLRAG